MLLSVCIPTYNRAKELPALLDSIVAQSGHRFDVEVVVSDNASSDDSQDIVAGYAHLLPGLIYSRSPTNVGYDRNVLRAVSLATGTYCWLMGSDDKFEDGAFRAMERALRQFPDIGGASIARRGYFADLRTPMRLPELVADQFDRPTLLHGIVEVTDRIGLALGTLCGLLVDRQIWQEVVAGEQVDRHLNSYVQTYMALQIMCRNGRWLCIPDRLVGYRSGNDSFAQDGQFKRLKIDVVGYDQNFGAVLGRDSAAFQRLSSNVLIGHVRHHLLSAKLRGEKSTFWIRSFCLLFSYYRHNRLFWTKVVFIVLVPRQAAVLARWLSRCRDRAS